jgi:1,4-alpha-glucan branching enzyme
MADGTGLIALDPWLAPYEGALRHRYNLYLHHRAVLERHGGLLGHPSQAHHVFGLVRGELDAAPGVWFREWAPGAHYVSLFGEFNGWDRGANPLQCDEHGVWYGFFPDSEYGSRIVHGSEYKLHIASGDGGHDRIPAYATRVVQDPATHDFEAVYWNPPHAFEWQNERPNRIGALRIYESHVGMATEEERVGTFEEFARDILPKIADLGYNAVQLMAVMEHPYYGSFGYHVSNFYAVSSRFGTPEDLKALVDAAHGLGLQVIMDIVHSHTVKNTREGLARFDGTSYQYFHEGARGEHRAWDSLVFDYGKYEVQRFLLSNARYWLEEYRFDGFRFDGVTSMLYLDHGLGRTFSSYNDYFYDNLDADAAIYLMLVNDLLHTLDSDVITVAEDVSGMPGMAWPVSDGGLGFDYRLAMGVPDFWIKLLKETPDEEWPLGYIYLRLLDRRYGEKHIGYVESHDQALVGDKTLAFRMMDAEMYSEMGTFSGSAVVDRGVALHKLIRLLTFALAGEGYLNFMGNEFGHPEWIDFPREGNNFSYHFARRQWSLAEREDLRYRGLREFDRAMNGLDIRFDILEDPLIEQLALHEDTRQLVFRRGPLVFAFNFHPHDSYTDLRIPVPDRADYEVVLDTDQPRFSGHARVHENVVYPVQPVSMYGREQSVQIYLPSRSAQVLAPHHA